MAPCSNLSVKNFFASCRFLPPRYNPIPLLINSVLLIGTNLSIVTSSQRLSALSISSIANNTELNAPIDVPEKTDMYLVKFNCFNAFQTPSSYAPFPPPPANTNPIFILSFLHFYFSIFFLNKLYYKFYTCKIFMIFLF